MTPPSFAASTAAADAARVARLRGAGATHPGRVREHNEDALHLDLERGIAAVVDGLGGAAAGERAAATALAVLRQRLERRTGSVEERMREAITLANNEILRVARENPSWTGMGCVLTAAVIEDGQAVVGHVGDSRLYRLRAGAMEKVTHDHSPVGVREDTGEIGEREAMSHPRRHEVYRTVGQEEHRPLDPDFVEIAQVPFEADAALLLCSDGLTDVVPSGRIREIVAANAGNPAAIVDGLVDAANEAGGPDNVTAVFVAGEGFAAGAGGAVDADPGRGRRWFERPTVVFALGAACGMALLALVALLDPMGARRRAPVDPALTGDATAARVLRVGPGAPHARISDAMDRARPGDTVLVAPGRYRERIRLEEGVQLVAATPRAAILQAARGPAPAAAIVIEGVRSGRVSGIKIEGGPEAPLDIGIVARDAGVAIEDVEVSGARVAGVAIEGTGSPALRASHLHDNPGAGVLVRAPAAPRIAHNRIERNGRGLELEAGARAELDDNTIVEPATPRAPTRAGAPARRSVGTR